ncbi:hypothetical protein [uncultured Aquimarina sp.]|uniref:hypothetical protein n=1 Tax=uncultured Aquimarina sp. TaxID=575652 RepID=UPI00262AC4C4|nr:hypothetical protein [uncultured Aquimarina sp.]
MNYKIKNGIDTFLGLGFERRLDKIGDYCGFDNSIYFLKIKEYKDYNEYIIFVVTGIHKKEKIQGFDCFTSKYNKEEDIGVISPIEQLRLKFSFDFEKHYNLLKQYFPEREIPSKSKITGLSINSIRKKVQ